ncbi:asparagine synthase-related protein [Radiobacillus sp. PE A8.2]|uniref:asparagine synthase-related protein n=1 Tax=Radiobacillus sp. PE A8.2 TaxID=3380349 RepID=UPI00388EA4E1
MSAIAGILQIDNQPISSSNVSLMMSALREFPADDVQIWEQGPVFFGCHAQWITPESIGEPLPYYDSERKLLITADALIDNRKELFEQLHIQKDRQKNMPDSQLILLAYCKWGADVPGYLVGDFAFMIWDEQRQELFGARDFSGMRTLYYYQDDNRFCFCTTIEALVRLPYVRKQLNEEWLAEHLAIADMVDAINPTITVMQDIKQLPPNHSIIASREKIMIRKYTALDLSKKIKFKQEQDYVAAFQDVFQRAVNDRLRTTGQVGVQLSGGLDSGAIVGYAANVLKKDNKALHTYTYVPEHDFVDWTPSHRMADESSVIEGIVDHVGNINANYLSFQGISPYTEMDEWLDIMEMPYKFFENSFWLKGIYEAAKNEKVTMMLNGARGNFTISWGSALEHYSKLLRKMKWFRLYRELPLYSNNMHVSQKRVLSVISRKAFPFLRQSQQNYHLPALINESFGRDMNVYEKIAAQDENILDTSPLSSSEVRRQHFQRAYVWNATGTSATKLSLRYKMWNRDPTNDSRVIQYCLSIPENQFVKNGQDRALVRRSTAGYLPDHVRLNQKIRGVQGADWVHRMAAVWDQFLQELDQLVGDPVICPYLNIELIQSFIEEARDGPKPEYAFHPALRVLMRALIVYRYVKKLCENKGGDTYEEMATAGVRGT